jgi:hypothetical protein
MVAAISATLHGTPGSAVDEAIVLVTEAYFRRLQLQQANPGYRLPPAKNTLMTVKGS